MIIRLLLAFFVWGAAVAFATPTMEEKLCDAARRGDIPAMQALIEQGADINPKNKYGITPLLQAIGQNQTEAVRFLLKSGADPNLNAPFGSPLSEATGQDTEIVRLLIRHGANVNYFDEKYGISPLIDAVKLTPETFTLLKAQGHYIGPAPDILKTVQLLIDAGADVNHHDYRWETPLRIAVVNNNIATVRLLLKAGANVDIKNPNQPEEHIYNFAEDPILFVAASGYPRISIQITEMLLKAGADPNYRNFRHYDAAFDSVGITGDGYTPLTFAARWGHLPIVKLLLEYGADPCIPRTDGRFASQIAKEHKHKTIENLIHRYEKGKCAP
jgi:ankyrin repeat protein